MTKYIVLLSKYIITKFNIMRDLRGDKLTKLIKTAFFSI